jgi:hypothetical protein
MQNTKPANSFRISGFQPKVVAGEGFEPSQTEPKSVVLPLDDPAIASAKIAFVSIKKQTPVQKNLLNNSSAATPNCPLRTYA